MAKIIQLQQKEETPEIKELISTVPSTTLSTLMTKAMQIDSLCTDYNISRADSNRNIRFNEDAGITFVADDGVVRKSMISRYALGQLSSKIGVPARYIEKCVNSGRLELAQNNVNSWLDEYNKNLFLRDYNGTLRGVLSDRYSVCDSPDIIRVLDDAVDLNNFRVKGSYISEERLHIRLVDRDLLPIDGEDLFAGIFVDSSDVGRSILTVRFGIYKQVCTNGLVIAKAGGTLFEQKHIGITAEEFHEGLYRSLGVIDELTENAVEFVKLAKSKSCKLDLEDMERFIKQLRQTTNLSEEHAGKVIDLMKTKYELNHWGLINGITEVAQDFTLERRLELERIAGNILVA